MKIKLLFILLLISFKIKSQIKPVHFDTIQRTDLELMEIDLDNGNNYRFNTQIDSDSVIFSMPAMLPKGYFEAYYQNDSNLLAFTYYNFGNKPYLQQFYLDGSMKADSEYDKFGNMHGLHVVFDRNGEEIWHADYWHGAPESKYTEKYLKLYTCTEKLITEKKAFGCYIFEPTPMRERKDEILLKADGSFVFHNYKADCDCNRHSKGIWKLENGLLKLQAENSKIWPQGTVKTFAILANKGRNAVLVEINSYGLNWYASEFYKCKKCSCFDN